MSDEAIQRRSLKLLVRAALVEGLDDDAIAERLGVPLDDVRHAKDALLRDEAARTSRRAPADVFAEYLIKSDANMRVLDAVVNADTTPASIVVQAVKAKQVIMNDAIRVGQELGVIKRKAKETLHVHAHMDPRELHRVVADKLVEMKAMMERHGDVPFAEVAIDDVGIRAKHAPLPKSQGVRMLVDEQLSEPTPFGPVRRKKGQRGD